MASRSKSLLRPGPALALLACLSSSTTVVKAQEQPTITPFNWTEIEPTTDLRWVDCYQDTVQCTRLKVPQNYTDPSQGEATIAVIRVQSPLANTSDYHGPILFNPGGPGGSGVAELSLAGPGYQAIFGPQFDLVSFDPRGVNFSTPAIKLFSSSEDTQFFSENPDLLDLDPDSWPTLPHRIDLITEFGEKVAERSGEDLRHITTDNVARDMKTIVEAYGMEKIMYWGISYGTVLGSTFASMFPDKIERMVLDGVVDQEGYYTNDWTKNIADADKTLSIFLSHCLSAGPELCAFHAPSIDELTARYEALHNRILTSPPVLPDNSTLTPATFEAVVHGMLYWPHQYPLLAQALAGLESGEDLSAWIFEKAAEMGPIANAIRCGDAVPVLDSAEDLQAYDTKVRNATKYFPGAIEGSRMFCRGWAVHPDNFNGPIGVSNTSYPLLIVGNTADPVTPLSAARNTADNLFPGARLLTYDIPGHTSIAMASNCVKDAFKAYFLNGTLPEEGTVCEMSGQIFPDTSNATAAGNDTDTSGNSTEATDSGNERRGVESFKPARLLNSDERRELMG
jgi:pimeloyl-ACP methyl ester carboxylesterase